MLELKNKTFEGKNSEEVLNNALKELNASTNEVYYDIKEETSGGLFKSKKYKFGKKDKKIKNKKRMRPFN